jgi:carboxylate-amine ligase
MLTSHTLGIEEEFQTVHQQTGQLQSSIEVLLEEGKPVFGDRIKADLIQSLVEITTDVCVDISDARRQLQEQRYLLSRLAQKKGLALISSGTHPQAHWLDQEITQKERYLRQVAEFHDLMRSRLIFGLHIHVGIASMNVAIPVINQLRTWLPHLLALSSNSPFWGGRYTGIKSYRSVAWLNGVPRTGMPELFPSLTAFEQYIQDLTTTGHIGSCRDLWWDIRPHPGFGTVEFRICDMPATLQDTVALAALCQALTARLAWLHRQGQTVSAFPRDYLAENKWSATRSGLDATITDFSNGRRLKMRDAIHELLDFVDDVVDDLGSRHEMDYLRTLINSSQGTGADRQIALYQQTGNIQDVIQMLIEQTMEGLKEKNLNPA